MRVFVSSIFLVLAAVHASGVDATGWQSEWAELLQPKPAVAAVSAAKEEPVPLEVRAAAPDLAPDTATPVVEVPAKPMVFITPDQILHTLRDELVEKFDVEGDLELMPNTPLTKIEVPDDSWRVQLVDPLPATLSRRMHLRFKLTNGIVDLPEQNVALRAEWWREAFVSNRLLRPGDLNAKDAYETQMVNWLQHRGALVPVDSDLSALRLKSTWRANEPLRWSTVETRPVIEAGEIVEVVASEGALRISMRGVALENGRAGELISVRNLQSRKEIQGIVSHENTVLVVF